MAAAIASYGFARLPHGGANARIRDGRLCHVLDGYTTPVGGLQAVYPSSRHLPPLVKTLIELAARRLNAGADGSATSPSYSGSPRYSPFSTTLPSRLSIKVALASLRPSTSTAMPRARATFRICVGDAVNYCQRKSGPVLCDVSLSVPFGWTT
ncbi:hypothetical protein ABID08_000769 [Rhizobium binae]|uniref:LysR substrate-binding domain-containing protein n=1 Tax=Rhizobium binae TaxID=1138190 RepID=A0ABV2MAC7_9HYPH